MLTEIREFLEQQCERIANHHDIPLCFGLLKQLLLRFVMPKIDYANLVFLDRLKVQMVPATTLEMEYRTIDQNCKQKVVEALASLTSIIGDLNLEEVKNNSSELDKDWVSYKSRISNYSVLFTNKILIGSRWESSPETKFLRVGAIFECNYVVYSKVWQEDKCIEFIAEVVYNKELFAVCGQTKAKIIFKNQKDQSTIRIALCPLKPGILFYPQLKFELLTTDTKVSFQLPNDQSDLTVQPKEEFAIRYFQDLPL